MTDNRSLREDEEVEIISRIGRFAITSDGQRLPITNWIDSSGDECESEDAAFAVAGPTETGQWLSIDLRSFEYGPLN